MEGPKGRPGRNAAPGLNCQREAVSGRDFSDTQRTICFCNSNIPWGGGENWHLNAAVSFAARGWRVLLLCHPAGELFSRASVVPGLTTLPLALGRLSFLNPFVGKRLKRLFQREKVHALIMNLPADLKAAGPAARAAGVRHILYRRGSALPVRNSLLNRYLYGQVITRLIANSQATRAMALVNNPDLIPADRITVLPNGIDIRAFDAGLRAAARQPSLRTAFGEDGKNLFILGNAGRLTLQKGQHLLLRLGRRLLNQGLDCRIILAGAGERERELRALASALRLEQHVLFTGFLADLSRFWLDIDLFVLSSLWEGFGNVILEAGLAQKPVFAFAVSNIPELIHDAPDGNGRLFPLPEEEAANCPEDPWSRKKEGDEEPDKGLAQQKRGHSTSYASLDAMARAILFLARNPEQGKHMGLTGRRMAARFSQDACMDKLETLIQ